MFSPLRRDPTVQESRAHSSVTSKVIAALTGPRPVSVGNTVLTLETGGVALFALQVTKLCGARVIAMTSSDEKIEKALRADEVMNYSMIPDRECIVRELTGGRSVDHVIETHGVETLERSIKSVAPASQIALVSVRETDQPCRVALALILRQDITEVLGTLHHFGCGVAHQLVGIRNVLGLLTVVVHRVTSFRQRTSAAPVTCR
jgi:NADPH:quinone reductase-like Zn-dependent oxidoreductase